MTANARNHVVVAICATACLTLGSCQRLKPGDESILPSDPMEDTASWRVLKPRGTSLDLSSREGLSGNALCLDYDLDPDNLYVVAHKDVTATLPSNYEFSFYIRGVSPRNNLEFKVIDERSNTFLKVWKNYRFSEEWTKLVVTKRDLRYGWGPAAGAKLEEVVSVEFAITSGRGGQGEVLIDELTLHALPAPPPRPPMKARASSSESPEHIAQYAVDDSFATKWRSKALNAEWLEIDLGKSTPMAGLVLHWAAHGNYDILLSPDGETWQRVYSQDDADGGLDEVYFRKTKARFVKISGKKIATRNGYQLLEVEIIEPDKGVSMRASSERKKEEASKAMDGNLQTQWHSKGTGEEWMRVDLQGQKAFGGLVIHWGKDYAQSYEIQHSCNGMNWSTVHSAANQNGGIDKVYLEETEARFLRILCKESGTGDGYAITNIELKAPDEEMTVTTFYQLAAAEHPGCYPRWLSNEQAYWTIVGTPEDVKEGVICEDGTLEPHKRGFTIMPLLSVDGKLVTRNEAEVTQSLKKNYLPIPSVHWNYGDLRMDIQLIAHGGAQSSTYARYTLRNDGQNEIDGNLFLVVHPIQIYPPWQANTDGFSPIKSIAYSEGVIQLDEGRKIFLLTKPETFAAKGGTFQVGEPVDGDIVDDVARGTWPNATNAEDPEGFASGAAVYPFGLRPGESREIFVAVPLHDAPPVLRPGMVQTLLKAEYETMLRETVTFWESKVECVDVHIPDQALVDMWKANVAYNLITKDGPGFQPGSRSYDKAWMRDGGVAAIALLKMGLTEEIKDFLSWMAGFQFESGEVPPIIDNKHEDPLWEEKQGLQEFDSQGQFVHVILQYYHFTKDREFLEEMYPKIVKALEFLTELRERRATPEYRDDPEKRIFYNILPESRSHEGYWLAHSYWDDFWALAGWKDGKTIARILGHEDQAEWMETEYQKLKKGVYDTIALVMERNEIDYIPGCAEKGDFDPTSTAAAIVFCDELENMPQPQLKNTFDRFFDDLSHRFEPGAEFVLTPYEIRTVLAYLFMGQKERARKLLSFMVDCRRPPGWNHLAEVVHSDYRFPCYIGDMPHTWVGAGFINSARGLFLYEKDDALILGAGIDPRWLEEGRPISIESFPSYFGLVSYEMERNGDTVRARISGDAAPPHGFILKSPLDESPSGILVNGNLLTKQSNMDACFNTLPAEVVFRY